MIIFQNFVNSMMYILFPLTIFLLYNVYNKNLSNEVNEVFLSFMLVTSLYLLIRFSVNFNNNFCIILCNIPLLIAYLKKYRYTAAFLSIAIIFYYVNYLHFNIYLISIEYVIYYVIFNILSKNKLTYGYVINIFTIVKSSVLSFEIFYLINNSKPFWNNFMYILFLMILFYCISYCTLYMLYKCEEIVDLNNVLKELEREKVLKQSLFKMTHEIKNPIAVCKGYLDMIDTNNKIKADRYLGIIKSEMNRTLVLMDDFLDYNKIKINKELVDINLLIEDTFNSLESLLKSYHVEVIMQKFDEEVFMNIDYNRMKQVLINIVKNSLEAKKDNMIINLKRYISNNNFIIEIIDNGIGMDKETLKKVYDMFYTTKDKGTGLGVCLSKEIVELHNGHILYESELNKGTRVIITLPME